MANIGFPTYSLGLSTLDRLVTEGRSKQQLWSDNNFTATPATVTAGASVSTGRGLFVRPGRRIYVTGIVLTSDGPGLTTLVRSMDASGNWFSWIGLASASNLFGTTPISATFGPNGGSVTVPIGTGFWLTENSALTLNYTSFNTTGRNVSFTLTGMELPNESNMDASFRIAIFGDSTAQGANLGDDPAGRAFLGNSMWSEVLRDGLRARGVDAQLFCNMADDGRTMLQGYYSLLTGVYRVQYDLAVVSYGMNDAVSTRFPTEAKFKEAAAAWIIERNRYNPGKRLLFLGPNSTDDTDRTGSGRMDSIRTWISQVANDAQLGGIGRNVFYYDQSQSFGLNADRTVDLNFKSTERPAGQLRVHPSGAGSTKIGKDLLLGIVNQMFP